MAAHYKMKTNRAAAKRFSFTASGKIKRKKAGLRHFMRRRSVQTKRDMRNRAYVDKTNEKQIRALLPNG